MRNTLFSQSTIALVASLFLATSFASSSTAQTVDTTAEYAIIMDAESGTILFEKDAHQAMAPASMSKLMTVELMFQALKSGSYTLDDTLRVSRKAWKEREGSSMFVMVDTDIRVEDLLRGIIVQSGNDACIVIAEGLGGSEEAFAVMMTERAKELGMENSTFRNSNGMPDPEHLMSSYDLAILARHLITEYPEYYHYFAETEFTWSNIRQPNRNPVLFMNINADGLKTGHTQASGYGLISSAIRNGRRLIIAVNGLDSERQRANESRRLLDIGFRDFKPYRLLTKGEEIDKAPVWNGARSLVSLVVKENVDIHLHRLARKNLEVKLNYVGPVKAPIVAGTQVGTLTVTAPGLTTRDVAVYAGEDVAGVGLAGRIGHTIAYLLYGPAPVN